MKQDEFDAELERYLRARKSSKWNLFEWIKKILPKRESEGVVIDSRVEVCEKKSLLQKIKEKKESVVSRFKPVEKTSPLLSSDIKEVAKIALGVIRRLPDDELKQFKQSAEFEMLKEILKKHDLIRKDD